ncbi:MAG: malonate decarboxylase subunit epsilon [Rhodospirillales bacterium]|nr:malonate decarboxylase subunit epsilon [Rhodospirillales bacterium]
MSGLALLCSGQGAQHPKMFDVLATEPAAAPVLDAVSARLGIDVRDLGSAIEPARLFDNAVAQQLMVGHALAAHAALQARGIEAMIHAGYSVGELASHAVAGRISVETALDLAAERARCMDAARDAASAPQGMTGVIGLQRAQGEALAKASGAEIAIINGPAHLVFGGTLDALDRLEAQAPSMGARHIRRLDVRIASHTRWIATAAGCFAARLAETRWVYSSAPVLAGIDGRAVQPGDDTVQALSAQLSQALDWERCMQAVLEYGPTRLLELGPGTALTKIAAEVAPSVAARAVDEFRTYDGVASWAMRP